MVSSALTIEAWALRIACGLAVEQNFPEVIFESDYKNLITYATDSKAQCPWEIATIVADIKKWAGTRRWSFFWCNRGLNKTARSLDIATVYRQENLVSYGLYSARFRVYLA